MSGVCALIKEKLSVPWPNIRVASFIILSLLVVSCSPTHKFLGTKQPGLKKNSCPIESEFCTFSASKHEWKIIGTYYLDKLADGNYHLRGSVKVDVTEASPVFQSVSRLNLSFLFFQGDMVIHEEGVQLSGEANEYIEFSRGFDPDKELESSIIAWYNFRVTELPAMGASKKSNASEELLPKKTYIRIESEEQFYENGQPKFTANRGDILEVIRVKTCISGSSTCWQVRNIKTGETGFRRADVLKERHTVYEEREGSTSNSILEKQDTSSTGVLQNGLTGTYRSDITTNINNYYFQHKRHRKMIITFKQEGNRVTGIDKSTDTQITGTLEGDTVNFLFYSSQVNPGLQISGEWVLNDDGSRLEGSWSGVSNSGTWNLIRIE